MLTIRHHIYILSSLTASFKHWYRVAMKHFSLLWSTEAVLSLSSLITYTFPSVSARVSQSWHVTAVYSTVTISLASPDFVSCFCAMSYCYSDPNVNSFCCWCHCNHCFVGRVWLLNITVFLVLQLQLFLNAVFYLVFQQQCTFIVKNFKNAKQMELVNLWCA